MVNSVILLIVQTVTYTNRYGTVVPICTCCTQFYCNGIIFSF